MAYEKRIQKNWKEMVYAQEKVEALERLIGGAAFAFYEFFHENGLHLTRHEWNNLTSEEKSYLKRTGWLYAFYEDLGIDDLPIYTGETSRSVFDRFDEHKKDQSWWGNWTSVKILPCEDTSSRKLLEAILGFSGGYKANSSQPAHKEEILYLILLGLVETKTLLPHNSRLLKNRGKEFISVPNEAIGNNLRLIEDILCRGKND